MAFSEQTFPAAVSDGCGGAIVTWHDFRSGTEYDVYAQRVDFGGVARWAADGVPICTALSSQSYPRIVPAGDGGAIIVWTDVRSGSYSDIYAQRVSESGDVEWTADGAGVCQALGHQMNPMPVSDGSDGVIVVWEDTRNSHHDIYAQRIDSSGSGQWTGGGVIVSNAAGYQTDPRIMSDDAGGAIIVWLDTRSGDYDIYAQRVDASGTPQWMNNGVPICTETGYQWLPAVRSDGFGGALIAWEDYRSGEECDVYAQRVNIWGGALWTPSGVAISTAPGDQSRTDLVSDGFGGAVICWGDARSGAGDDVNDDIYAQWVSGLGGLVAGEPQIQSILDVAPDQGGQVRLAFQRSPLDSAGGSPAIGSYGIWRRIPSEVVARGTQAGS